MKAIRKFFASADRIIDTAIDLSIDIILILIDVLSSPIVLPAKLAGHLAKGVFRMVVIRKARSLTKEQVVKRARKGQDEVGDQQIVRSE